MVAEQGQQDTSSEIRSVLTVRVTEPGDEQAVTLEKPNDLLKTSHGIGQMMQDTVRDDDVEFRRCLVVVDSALRESNIRDLIKLGLIFRQFDVFA